MRVLVTGGTGFIGRALIGALVRRGDEVVALTRRLEAPASRELARLSGVRVHAWTEDWQSKLSDIDAVVNLAGEPVVGRRWSHAQKQRLRDSRLGATKALVEAMRSAPRPPAVFVSASAIGYYGARGDEPLEEASPPGSDFLARLCVDWEAEAAKAP
ncbi:MAG: hypothetical protein RL199_1256, partial [Pseudomonadota bacterium]